MRCVYIKSANSRMILLLGLHFIYLFILFFLKIVFRVKERRHWKELFLHINNKNACAVEESKKTLHVKINMSCRFVSVPFVFYFSICPPFSAEKKKKK